MAWHSGSEARNWGPSIHAALIDTDGRVIATRAVTTGDAHAKWRTLVALGDRVVLIWAGADEAGTFALYFEQLSTTDLSEITPRHPLARSEFANGDLIDPIATLGPNGDIAVLYDDNRAGIYRSYFTRITCIDFEIR